LRLLHGAWLRTWLQTLSLDPPSEEQAGLGMLPRRSPSGVCSPLPLASPWRQTSLMRLVDDLDVVSTRRDAGGSGLRRARVVLPPAGRDRSSTCRAPQRPNRA